MIVMATREASENTNSTPRTGPKKQFYYHNLLQMQKQNKKISWTHLELLTVSLHNILSYKYVCLAELTQIIGQLKDVMIY